MGVTSLIGGSIFGIVGNVVIHWESRLLFLTKTKHYEEIMVINLNKININWTKAVAGVCGGGGGGGGV